MSPTIVSEQHCGILVWQVIATTSTSPKFSSAPIVVEGTTHVLWSHIPLLIWSPSTQAWRLLEFSSDSPEGHKRDKEDWEHNQSESGASFADSASPFLAGLKHTNFADKDCKSKAGCFDELGEVRSMSSAQFTCQSHKEGYLEDRNDFYRKQLSYWRWEQQNWSCQKLWIGRDWHYNSRKSITMSINEQSLLAISQKPSVRRPNFTTYHTPISPIQIAIRIMQWTSFAQPHTKHNPWANLSLWNLPQFLDPQISDCLQSEEDKTNRGEDSSPVLLMDQ